MAITRILIGVVVWILEKIPNTAYTIIYFILKIMLIAFCRLIAFFISFSLVNRQK
jgi:hypothetical protein